MNSPEHLPSETHKPIGYLWGALAVLIPAICRFSPLCAGTTAGAFIGSTGYCSPHADRLVCPVQTRLLRAFKGRS
jgi:mercuric ion transport protein